MPDDQMRYDLKNLDALEWKALPTYHSQVLKFCQAWLQGQTQFTLYTSGSTGQAKAISLDREQMVASARLTGQALQLKAGDTALVCLSVAYIAGVMMLVRGLELGLAMTVIEANDEGRNNPLLVLELL